MRALARRTDEGILQPCSVLAAACVMATAVCGSREKRLTKIEWTRVCGVTGGRRGVASQRETVNRGGERRRQTRTRVKTHQCTLQNQGGLARFVSDADSAPGAT